jgi:hypothetical protein
MPGAYDPEHPPFGLPYGKINSIVRTRQANRSPLFSGMEDVLARYNGTWVLPVTSAEGEPLLPPLTPAIIANATDNLAVQASSVLESIWAPAVKPNLMVGKGSLGYANTRRQAWSATWYANSFMLTRRRAYRHLAAYATCCFVVVPDFKEGRPRIEIRNPLACLPEEKSIEIVREPYDCGFIFRRSGEELRMAFPKLREEMGGPISTDDTWQSWQTLEWFDEESIVYGLMGPIEQAGDHIADAYSSQPWMEICRFPNRAGMVPVIVPERVTLDRLVSHMANVVGIVDLQAKLRALHILAAEKGIWPTLYAIGADGRVPEIVSGGGQWQDGRTGNINLLKGVAKLDMIRPTPDMQIETINDRMERDANLNIDSAPMMNGENSNGLRTGRGLDTMASMSIDPKILELHEIMQTYLPILNKAVSHCYVGHWPDKTYTMFTGWQGSRKHVEFTPSVHLEESYENTVTYPVAGANLQTTTVMLEQMSASKLISMADARRRHPLVEDEEQVRVDLDREDLWDAQKRAINVQIASGQAPPELGLFLDDELAKGVNGFAAYQHALERVKAAQEAEMAAQNQAQAGAGAGPPGAPGIPGGGPPPPGAPDSGGMPPPVGGLGAMQPMPGQAAPGPGTPTGMMAPSANVGPNPDQAGLKRVMLALKAGQ